MLGNVQTYWFCTFVERCDILFCCTLIYPLGVLAEGLSHRPFLPLSDQCCQKINAYTLQFWVYLCLQANVKICSCWTSQYWAFWYRLFLRLSGQRCQQKIHSFKLQFGVHFKERKKSAHAAHWYSHWVFWQRDCCKGLFTLLSGWSCQEDVKYASHKHVLTSDGNIGMVFIIWKGNEDDGSPGSPWSGICQRRSSSDLTSCPCSVLAWNNIFVFFWECPWPILFIFQIHQALWSRALMIIIYSIMIIDECAPVLFFKA